MKNLTLKQKLSLMLLPLVAAPAAMAAPIALDTTDVIAQIVLAGAAIVAVGMAYLGMKAVTASIRLIRGAMS